MENKNLKVYNCATCPFMVEDTEQTPFCYITSTNLNYNFTSLEVAENCPLKENKYLIELDEDED